MLAHKFISFIDPSRDTVVSSYIVCDCSHLAVLAGISGVAFDASPMY